MVKSCASLPVRKRSARIVPESGGAGYVSGGTVRRRSVARGGQGVAVDVDGDSPQTLDVLGASDDALAAHPVRVLRIQLLQHEVELDRLHGLERLIGLEQHARLAQVDRPPDAP